MDSAEEKGNAVLDKIKLSLLMDEEVVLHLLGIVKLVLFFVALTDAFTPNRRTQLDIGLVGFFLWFSQE